MTFPILASLLVRLVVLLPFQLLRLSLATPSRWTPLALSRSEERFSRNAETDLVCRLLLEKKKSVGALHLHPPPLTVELASDGSKGAGRRDAAPHRVEDEVGVGQ